MKETCPTCGHEGDEITCDYEEGLSVCVSDATSYCDGCECWRCDEHECECGKGLE